MTEFIIVLICLSLNAIFSCIEMAFITVSQAHIKQMAQNGSSVALRLLKMKRNPERALSVLQIGITLVGAISAAVGGAGAEEHLSPWIMQTFSVSEEVSEYIAIIALVLPLTYASVVLGELVPKSLALKFPMRIALWGGALLLVMDRMFAPAVFVLEISTKFFTRLLFPKVKSEQHFDEKGAIDIDPLPEDHKQYVFNLIALDKRTVQDIMLPWEKAAIVDVTDHYLDVLEKIKTSGHTRLPVVKNKEVIGLLHTKEFVAETEVSKIEWTALVRPILALNPKQSIVGSLKKLQLERNHMALVTRGEQPLGIVTIEDIFEEVVGEIFDEDDDSHSLLATNSRIRAMKLAEDKKKNSYSSKTNPETN